MKKLSALILAVILLATVLSLPVLADNRTDTDALPSLRVCFNLNDKPMRGVRFALYCAAVLSDDDALTLTEAFRSCGAEKLHGLTADENQKLCETLYAYLEQHRQIVPDDTGLTDANGWLSFPNQAEQLLPGLYLLVSERFYENGVSYEAAPMIVTLPYSGEDDIRVYDLSVSPKTTDTGIDVQKLWQDAGYEKLRPESITVSLLRGLGQTVYDTAVLSEANGWQHTWKNLPGGYQWSVREELRSEIYSSVTEHVPGGFRIINTYTAPPLGETLPQTGLLWWPIPVLTVAGVALFVIGWKKLRKCKK